MKIPIEHQIMQLQQRMEEQALIYKDTNLDPFYRFIIGEMNWEECCNKVKENITR